MASALHSKPAGHPKGQDDAQDLTVPAPYYGPFAFAYLAGVVRGTTPEDMRSSLATNILVAEILDAARQSAAAGKMVRQFFIRRGSASQFAGARRRAAA